VTEIAATSSKTTKREPWKASDRRATPDGGSRSTKLILIKLGDVLRISARRTAAFCSRRPTVPGSRLLTFRAILSLAVLSANRMKIGPGGGSRVQEVSRTAFVGDQMTHGGQKGFGMTKHGRSGHATRSPRFRFLQKLEAQKNDRKDRSCIKDPKQSVEELFHPRKPPRT
jgi:hypothetical protein